MTNKTHPVPLKATARLMRKEGKPERSGAGCNFETKPAKERRKKTKIQTFKFFLIMAKFIHGFFPNYKLHKVCSDDKLRPVYGYLYFKNGNVYATNAYIAIAAPLSFVSNFDDEEKAILEGILIHATQFATLKKMRETHVGTSDGAKFECKTQAGETVIIPLLTEDQIGKFPNVENVIAEAEKNAKELGTQLPRVGFKPSLLADLTAAMNADIIEFYFGKPKGAIVVRDQDDTNRIRAVLMPCLIEDPKF